MSPKALEIARNYAEYWNRQEPDLPVIPTDVAGLSRIFREGSIEEVMDWNDMDTDLTVSEVLELLQGNGIVCRYTEDGKYLYAVS
jgi:hypothetical protein